VKIIIPGIPQAKMRHKLTTRGGFARMYDPQEKEKRELKSYLTRELSKLKYNESQEIAMEASNLTSGDFYLFDVCFYVPCPKSATTGKRNAMLWGLIRPNTKPDYDNLAKFISDCANEVLYPDDCMIVESSQKEYYSDNPRTEIIIMARKEVSTDNSTRKILSIIGPREIEDMLKLTQSLDKWINSTYRFSGEDLDTGAAIISQLADLYGSKLTKVTKTCPQFWKKNSTKD
jgi:Holliday junction resolvase RusA-like endonuclease